MGLLIALLVFALLASLLFWALRRMPLPEPLRTILIVVFVIVSVVVLLDYVPLPRGRYF